MNTATPPKSPPALQLSGQPSTRSLLRWGVLVLVLHLVVLLSLAGTLDWQLSPTQTLRTGPMQTRTIAAPAAATTATDPGNTPAARTRIALVKKPAIQPKPDATHTAAAPKTAPADKSTQPATSPEPEQISASDLAEPDQLTSPDLVLAQSDTTKTNTDPSAEMGLASAAVPQASGILVAEASVTVSPSAASTPAQAVLPSQRLPTTGNDFAPAPAPTSGPLSPPTAAPLNVKAEAFTPNAEASTSIAANAAVAKPDPAAPDRIASATMALPQLALASLPPSALLSYRLSGQEKGINYQASGELRWQRNDSAYAMNLSVKAFLLGSRHWRSVGQINTTGLAPTRFSDSWRSERATHFDRPNQRIVFSSNAPTAPLQPGAQDQVSLYAQLAAVMAQSGQRMPPGTRLQIQTATVRDALPWLLTLEKLETLQVDGKSLQAVKWVCQPRNRFDAQVEFWVSAAHDWLPARIRITQVSGSFIDLQLTGREVLGDLPPVQ